MGINKKRIAQRQEAAAKAEKAKKTAKTVRGVGFGCVALGVLICLIVSASLLTKASQVVYADIAIKDYGTVTVRLDKEAAPITCENFIQLAESGYYTGTTFHRIIENFMMQGGDGKDVPTIKGEFSSNGWENPLEHVRGTISMARTNDPNSANSQFFIVHQDSPHLNGDYAAFGTVTAGMEIVDKICTEAEPTDGNGSIAADQQPVIESVTIRKN